MDGWMYDTDGWKDDCAIIASRQRIEQRLEPESPMGIWLRKERRNGRKSE
jgi:hypothetical protein